MYLQEYHRQIKSGRIVAGKKVIKIYDRLMSEINNPKLPYTFDEQKAQRPIEFIEKFCKQSIGVAGLPLKLELFQKAYIEALFGFIYKDTGYRRFQESLFLVARKNGKTTMLAAIALYMLIADKESSAECYSVATKQDQAKKTFDEIVAMRKYSEAIQSVTRKRRSDLYMPETLSSFKPLASDSKTLDGLNSHLVIIDELHAIRDRELYEVMRQSMSARRQPLLVMITTAGTVRESIFDDIYSYANSVLDEVVKDDTFLPIMYELDDREEWLDSNMWVKSNPGLSSIKQLKYMHDVVERAKNDSKALSGVLVKDFNIRGTTTDSWLSFEVIENKETFEISEVSNSYSVCGCDLSSTTDLTCATMLVVKNDKKYVLQQYFIPSELLDKRVKEDKVPYDLWVEQGWVTTCEGSRVNYSDVTAWFNKMRDEYQIYPLWVGYDRWGAQYWVEEMVQNGYQMESVIQGAITMSQPMKELEADLLEKRVVYNNNPVLKWCFTNTQIKSDENGNIRPVKGRNQKQRIDGVVSLIDAYVVLHKRYDDYMNMAKE
jgi:phage terminase large subunit-like protein